MYVQHLDSLQNTAFSSTSNKLQAHALHNKLLDDDHEALDQRPIELVLSPAILVRGKSDGTSYDVSRVWKPAIVYMGP